MPSESKSKASSVASVEGQRTGEPEIRTSGNPIIWCCQYHKDGGLEGVPCPGAEAVDPEGDAAYWRARAETAELKVLTFHEEIAKLKSVPGVEGMGAREMWKNWPLVPSIARGLSLEQCRLLDEEIVKFAIAYARSLRGAGGETDESEDIYPDYQDAVARLHASESREQAMRECLGKLVELLSRIEPTMYNPFEPDNQSKNYIAVKAAIENAEKLLKP